MKQSLLDLFQAIGLLDVDTKNFMMTDAPVGENQKVIGDMNELEKACKMFLDAQNVEHEKLHEKLSDAEEDSEEYAELDQQHARLKINLETVKGLMWASIRNRFVAQKGSSGFGLRNENKIVEIFKNEEDEDDDASMSGMMMVPGLGMIIAMGHR